MRKLNRITEEQKAKLPSQDQLMVLIQDYRSGSAVARDTLLEELKPLIESVASKYKDQLRDGSRLDLVKIGGSGLLRAAEKFDIDSSAKFTAYSTWWIKREIEKAFGDTAKQ